MGAPAGEVRQLAGRLQPAAMWALDGRGERVFTALALVAEADADEDLNWAVSVDSTLVRTQEHAAGVRKIGDGAAERHDHAAAAPAAD